MDFPRVVLKEQINQEDLVRKESACAFCGCLLTTANDPTFFKCKEYACEICCLEYQDAID